MKTIACRNCGQQVNPEAAGCQNCGANPQTGVLPERIFVSAVATAPLPVPAEAVALYANRIRRLVAVAIDLTLASIVGSMVYLVIPHPALNPNDWASWHDSLLLQGAIIVGCWYVYLVVLEAAWGTTAGKWILRVHVTMLDGRRCTPVAALLRNAPKIVLSPWITGIVGVAFAQEGFELINTRAQTYTDLAILLCLVIALVAMSQSTRRQRLGDMMARTVVSRMVRAEARIAAGADSLTPGLTATATPGLLPQRAANGQGASPVGQVKIFCPSCGTGVDPHADSFCPGCGKAQLQAT